MNKMTKLQDIVPVYVETMPKEKEHGILYISKEYKLAIHLCACGCGGEAVTSLTRSEDNPEKWTLIENNGLVSLKPSIGNWSGEKPKYHAHYFITDNKIDWR